MRGQVQLDLVEPELDHQNRLCEEVGKIVIHRDIEELDDSTLKIVMHESLLDGEVLQLCVVGIQWFLDNGKSRLIVAEDVGWLIKIKAKGNEELSKVESLTRGLSESNPSVEDRDTTDCNCEYHTMGPPARMVICLEMDLPVHKSVP